MMGLWVEYGTYTLHIQRIIPTLDQGVLSARDSRYLSSGMSLMKSLALSVSSPIVAPSRKCVLSIQMYDGAIEVEVLEDSGQEMV